MKHQRGFTLIEILVSMFVMVGILSISSILFTDFWERRNREAEVSELIAVLTLAQSKSSSGIDNTSYKVVFSNSDYRLENEAEVVIETKKISEQFDLIYSSPEIAFEKNTGKTFSCVTLCTLEFRKKSSTTGQADLSINSEGIINEE